MPESKLIALRVTIRKNVQLILNYIIRNHVRRENDEAIIPSEPAICIFCGRSDEITREHVIPRWIFEKDTNLFFKITLNGQSLTYNKTVIPACKRCNGELLNDLECNLQALFETADPKNRPFTVQESENLIRWLEIIDYKFHVLNITKQFLGSKEKGYIPYLKDFPLYMLLPNKDYLPSQVIPAIRRALTRISIKDKTMHVNSLVIFTTSNKNYHFFHTLNEFIFLELPKYGIAIFYFYAKIFETHDAAYKEAMEIIKKAY